MQFLGYRFYNTSIHKPLIHRSIVDITIQSLFFLFREFAAVRNINAGSRHHIFLIINVECLQLLQLPILLQHASMIWYDTASFRCQSNSGRRERESPSSRPQWNDVHPVLDLLLGGRCVLVCSVGTACYSMIHVTPWSLQVGTDQWSLIDRWTSFETLFRISLCVHLGRRHVDILASHVTRVITWSKYVDCGVMNECEQSRNAEWNNN